MLNCSGEIVNIVFYSCRNYLFSLELMNDEKQNEILLCGINNTKLEENDELLLITFLK